VHADPDVTLQQDLARRDLTINAMARAADGTLIDPHGGLADLRTGASCGMSARPSSRTRCESCGWHASQRAWVSACAPETLAPARQMAGEGQRAHLVAERVWQETARALGEPLPDRYLRVLTDCGALPVVFPELGGADARCHGHAVRPVGGRAAGRPVEETGALLALAVGDTAWGSLCTRLRVPGEVARAGEDGLRTRTPGNQVSRRSAAHTGGGRCLAPAGSGCSVCSR
jgi:tRNA nucleotidyltransferase (CCA-adding enzyme)